MTSPFLLVLDAQGRSIGWALITAPIVTAGHHRQLAELTRDGCRLGGMTGYLAFPRCDGVDVRDYSVLCEAWCHCFREPDAYLPSGSPRALISESDFTDPEWVATVGDRQEDAPPYDIVYVGTAEPWKRDAKGWMLAARALPRVCEALDLRALVVGPEFGRHGSHRIDFTHTLPWPAFLARLARSRLLFVPNVLDASPRVLAEALSLDVPLVVNRQILGGWKYVNVFTGEFFDGDADIEEAVRRCLDRPRQPHRWFRANHGPWLASERLISLLRHVDPSLDADLPLILSRPPPALRASRAATFTTRRGSPSIGER